MRKVAILTLTRYPDIFMRLSDSIERYESKDIRRVVVTSGGAEINLNQYRVPWEVVEGVEPFVFARNVNRGLAHIGPDYDVLLVNDDCTWSSSEMILALSSMVHRDPSIGLLAPQVDGGVGNPDQHITNTKTSLLPFESPNTVCFVCVFLPASTLSAVGPLDERFVGYGGDDVEYCERVQSAGLRCCITSLASIKHGFENMPFSASFRRVMGAQEQQDSMKAMNRLVEQKLAKRVALVIPSSSVPRSLGCETSMAALRLPEGSQRLRMVGHSAARNRNNGIRAAGPQITHFFFADDDHYYPEDTVMRLLAHRKPVVCALTPLAAPPFWPVAFKDIEMLNGVPHGKWFNHVDLKGQSGLIEIPSGPGSGILIARDILERIGPPWFAMGKYDPEETSEDTYFYERIRNLTNPRVPIYLDLNTRIGHYAPVATSLEPDDDGNWQVMLKWDSGTTVKIPAANIVTVDQGPGVKESDTRVG